MSLAGFISKKKPQTFWVWGFSEKNYLLLAFFLLTVFLLAAFLRAGFLLAEVALADDFLLDFVALFLEAAFLRAFFLAAILFPPGCCLVVFFPVSSFILRVLFI